MAGRGDTDLTRCTGCGDCCDPVGLHVTPRDVRARPGRYSDRFAQWVTDELVPLATIDEVYARLPSLRAAEQRRPGYVTRRHWYRCPHLDAATRRCSAYDRRPSACAGFPWYRGQPRYTTLLGYPRCSFHADVERRQLHIVRATE